jgi:hypothetical protein
MQQARSPGTTSACTRRSDYPPSRHHLVVPSPSLLLTCYAATAVTRDSDLLHGNASRQYGTRQRSGARGVPTPPTRGLLPTTAASRIPHDGPCCFLIHRASTPTTTITPHTAGRAAISTAATAAVAAVATRRGEEAFTAFYLESSRIRWE